MQSEFHIARETQPPVARGDFAGNQSGEPRAVRHGVGRGRGKFLQMGG